MIDNIVNSDSIPALERMVQFTGQRHRLIAHNVANLTTPGFRPADVSPEQFQAALGEAIDERRGKGAGASGPLMMEGSDGMIVHKDGITLDPEPKGENILYHDGNDRDLDRTMQGLVENFMTFRTAAEMLRSRFELLNLAIRERI
jgi:flagellar basal-body rod protein FlgB